MLKAGIFLDIENLSRNGGWGMRYDPIKALVEAQGATVLRANAYIASAKEKTPSIAIAPQATATPCAATAFTWYSRRCSATKMPTAN